MSISKLAKKKYLNMHNTILARSVPLGPMSQTKLTVVKSATGLIFTNPRSYIVPMYKVRADNGVTEVLLDKLFSILLSNLGHYERKFPKGMVFSYAKMNPLALVQIVGQSGKEISRCRHISGGSDVGPKEEEDEVAPEEKYAAKYLEESVYLSHLDD